MARKPVLSDDRLVSILDYGIFKSVGFSESRLSKERERVQYYYDGERPRKGGGNDSGYMSLDVYDGVEDMKAQLLDVFTANVRPVQFNPVNAEDVQAAQVRTDYCSYVLFQQNNGFKLFEDTITAGLLGRNAVCKVWWEPKIKTEYAYLSDTNLMELTAYLQQHPDAKVVETKVRADSNTISRATIKHTKDVSQVRIKLLAGEEFGISPMAEDIETAELVWHRQEMTVSDLIKAGYDAKTVKSLQDNDRLWMAMEPEKIARFRETDDLIGTKVNEDGQLARRVCLVYECYQEIDVTDDDDADEADAVSQLYKITKVGDTVLDKEPVDWKPFVAFCPLPRPFAFWGHNYAKLLIPTQSARTYLTRSIINHAMITNNPRMQVVRGGLLNPRELMENKFGGIINVQRPDSLIPLQQASLNPFVYQTIGMLKDNKEEISSISALSQGLNKDAISKQNSGEMVHELISVGSLRQKIIARNFAEGFLVPLYTKIYLLCLENESRAKIEYISGAWVNVDFSQWPDETPMSVSFALGYGEQANEVAKWVGIHKTLSEMPALAGNYTPAQQYAVARNGILATGIKDVDTYLLPPNKAQPPPPNPLQQAEIAVKNADAATKQATAQSIIMAQQNEAAKIAAQERIELAKINLETMKVQAELRLKQDTLSHQIIVDAAEIKLQDAAQQIDKLTAVAEPK